MYKYVLLGQIAPENYYFSIYFYFLSNLKCHFYIHIFILAAQPPLLLDYMVTGAESMSGF